MVKVYDGSVYVANPPNERLGKPLSTAFCTRTVPGPHEVPPPCHEVTMEEWHVIVKAMQQISISRHREWHRNPGFRSQGRCG